MSTIPAAARIPAPHRPEPAFEKGQLEQAHCQQRPWPENGKMRDASIRPWRPETGSREGQDDQPEHQRRRDRRSPIHRPPVGSLTTPQGSPAGLFGDGAGPPASGERLLPLFRGEDAICVRHDRRVEVMRLPRAWPVSTCPLRRSRQPGDARVGHHRQPLPCAGTTRR